MSIKEVTTKILEKAILEFKKEENLTKIQVNFLDPLIQYTFGRLYPYIIITSIIFFLIFMITIALLLLMIKITYK